MPRAHTNGIDLFYKVQGHGEPLFMIMGLGGGRGAWFFQTRSFRRYFTLITFDSRGIGKSDKAEKPYTIRTMADDTVGLMDYLEIDKAHILGMSMGGIVAQEIAINYPDRVGKLILAATTPGEDENGDSHPEIVTRLGLAKEGSTDIDYSRLDSNTLLNSLNQLAFNRKLYRWFIVPFAKVYMKRIGGSEGPMRQFKAAVEHSTVDRLHMIQAPTLVITGADDRLVPPHHSEVLASMISGARLVKIKGGSHTLIVEQRGAFNRVVLDFLRHSELI
jgi:pimeloyl-ACP methyl ester carboxylesterase